MSADGVSGSRGVPFAVIGDGAGRSGRPFPTATRHLALAIFMMAGSVCWAARPNGMDVSHWQGEITPSEWQQAYNSGRVFCFTKATQGNYFTDGEFFDNMEEGSAAGILMGCYHFADPVYVSATAEADYFVSVAGPYLTEGYLRPVLDLEWGSSLGKTALSNWVNTFLDRVEQLTGIEPLIYTNSNFATNYLNTSVSDRDLWIAQWYPSDPQTDEPNIGVFHSWAFWQWTDSCSIPGIGSSVDCDVFNGTMEELQGFLIGGPPVPPTVTTHPSNQIVDKGQTASFSVSADGSDPLSYQWLKNGSNLVNGGNISGATTATLQISNCWNGDEGGYRCSVSNDYGSVLSNPATLTVISPPPDLDEDGDVDMVDFGLFQVCLTGLSVPVTDPDCYDARLDGDGDVDQNDVSIFLACMSGPNVAPDPACAE